MKPLEELINKHTYILKEALRLTRNIEKYAENSKIDSLISESDNRERLINLLTYIQMKIEEMISAVNLEQEGGEYLELLKNWQLEFNKMVEVIDELNKKIIIMLENNKDDAIKEIGALFKSKENFKGYNLNNVKK